MILSAFIAISTAQEGDDGGALALINGTEDRVSHQRWRAVRTDVAWGLGGLAGMARGIAYGFSPSEFPLGEYVLPFDFHPHLFYFEWCPLFLFKDVHTTEP